MSVSLNQRLATRLATFPKGLGKALICSQLFAVLWFLVAYYLRSTGRVPAWYDQETTFLVAPLHVLDPYTVPRFGNPPWAAVLLLPFSILPFYLAVLLQAGLYLALLTLIIFKFGGNFTAALIMMTSFIALDSVMEINLEWLICIGLLVPPAWSSPFLLIKPQDALGVMMSYKRRDFVRIILLSLVVVLISLIIWRDWPLLAWKAIQANVIGQSYNIAPMALLPWFISLAIGLVLAWRAFRQKDAPLALLAWIFFVPYIPLYSLTIPFAALTVRFQRLALIVSMVMWIIYGGVILISIFAF